MGQVRGQQAEQSFRWGTWMRTSTTRFSLCRRQWKSRSSVLASSAGAAEPLLTNPGLAFPARVDGLRTNPGLPVAADGLVIGN